MENDKEELECRRRLIEWLGTHGMYGMIWNCHSCVRLCVMKPNGRAVKCGTYVAVYESFYDFVKDDTAVSMFDIDYGDKDIWKKFYGFASSLAVLKV